MTSHDSLIPTQDRTKFRTRLKKIIPKWDKSVEPKSSKRRDGHSNDTSSKSMVPKGSSDTTGNYPLVESSVATSKVSPRLAAEVEFRAAAIKLNEAIAGQYQVPEAFVLQTVDHVNDVEAACLKLETAIDTIIDRRMNDSKVDKQVWKDCIRRWYCALFPYVQPCLTTATVYALYEFQAYAIAKDIVPSPYGLPIKGLTFILQVLSIILGTSKHRLFMMPVNKK